MLDRKLYAHITTYPSILTRSWVVIVWTSFLYIGYQLTNRYQVFQPTELPLFEFEQQIPFLMWTVIPYFLLIGGMYLPIFIRSSDNFLKSLYAFAVAVCINYSIFLFYPTVYPRPELPEMVGVSGWAYHWLVGIDTPANCFPSGHVCVPAIGIWYVSREFPQHRYLLWFSFLLLVLTVLTTKQHYAVDILAGLVTASIGIASAEWIYKRRIGKEIDSQQ